MQNISIAKLFPNTVNPLNNALGVYLIIEIFQGVYWREPLKKRGVNKINKIQKLCIINSILHRYEIKYLFKELIFVALFPCFAQ